MKTNSQGECDEPDEKRPYYHLDVYDLRMGGSGTDDTESPATTADMNSLKELIEEGKKRTAPVKKGYEELRDGSITFTND